MSSEPDTRRPPVPPEALAAGKDGFSAELVGIGLPDLIQVKCLSGVSEGLRIASGASTGVLQFSFGHLTHAKTGVLLGDAAVFEMLSWSAGTCEPASADLGSEAGVTGSWQHLLLAAARAVDERARFKQQSGQATQGEGATMQENTPEDDGETTPTMVRSSASTVKLDADGRVLVATGDAEELSAATAYLLHVAEHIGARMGLDAFRGCEFRGGELRTVVFRQESGEVVAVQSRDDREVAKARSQAGL